MRYFLSGLNIKLPMVILDREEDNNRNLSGTLFAFASNREAYLRESMNTISTINLEKE